MFAVSQEAVAYRILEMPRVRAVFLKIDLKNGSCSFRSSQVERVALARTRESEAAELLARAGDSMAHQIGVVTSEGPQSISAAGVHRVIRKVTSASREYWVVGWQSASDTSERASLNRSRTALQNNDSRLWSNTAASDEPGTKATIRC
jgi:hypothetical protein